ncbi:MAG: DNA mismatch repair endonuclease MutL [Chloroflexi bacterium]|nr:DNA mismatch repair endonuclease MutL [Chloroflexota bacterium]
MVIRVLDREVAAQIAAGEVVERPASVVKELVENALDAGASQVAVEARGGGVDLIRVADNGGGIPAGEAALAFERHATSKVRGLADLEAIGSLGFRGEALPSIAAVALVEVLTRAGDDETGSYLRLEDGAMRERRGAGRDRGTTMTVRHLFRRVPARLKFLKSTATEAAHIAQVVSQYALAYPEVSFSLTLEGKTTLRTPGRGRLLDGVMAVYGTETARRMLEIDSRGDGPLVTVTGLAAPPALSRPRSALSLFVNRRWVQSRRLAWSVEEAYHGLLMTGRHPVAVINIALPPALVDVNIHPAKSEVKFRDESLVFAAVQRAVRRTLVAQSPAPALAEPPALFTPPVRGLTERRTAPEPVPAPPAAPPLLAGLPVLRVLGQAMGMYIVAEGPDGLYVIDQHAAHERVLFEKLRGQAARREAASQVLLEPATFEVSPAQAASLKERLAALSGLGFGLEPFGVRAYLVRSVPAVLDGRDWRAALGDLLDAPEAGAEAAVMRVACHAAVRAGQALTTAEMREIIIQLEQSPSPHTCPHGRPVMLSLSAGQLGRTFRR